SVRTDPASRATRRPRAKSGIPRHRRGHPPLRRSYSTNMLALGIPLGVLSQPLSAAGDTAFADAPPLISALLLCFLASYGLVCPWHVVGVWCAAANHVANVRVRHVVLVEVYSISVEC